MTDLNRDPITTEAPYDDRSLVLIVVSGGEPGRRYPVGHHTLIIGRDPECDVHIDDKRVSRQHARIEPEDDGSLLLVDNGSSNGTFVNGRPIEQHHLDIGDRIGLGRGVMLLFARSGRFDDQVLQAQKLQALGSLAGRVAHDFNNLLTTILANASILRNPDAAIDREQALLDIENAARNGSDLTKGLLSFARAESPMRDTVNVSQVLRDVERLAAPQIAENVDLDVSIGGDLFVFGYHQRLVNAVLNLVLNANEAMPEGGRLSLRGLEQDLSDESSAADWLVPGRYVVIVVEDTGVGMSDATLHRIYEPFYTTKAAGTGMGLAIAYGTIRDHGGQIRVNTTPGVGTLFRLLIPSVDT